MMPTSPRSPLSFRTAGFPQYDEVATAGLPAGEERKLERDRGSTLPEGALEGSVEPNIFESLNDGLVSEPVTPNAAA